MTNALSGSYEHRIELAIKDLSPAILNSSQYKNSLSDYRDLADHDPLPLLNPSSTAFMHRPGEVLVEDSTELPVVFALLEEMTGARLCCDYDCFVRHEALHESARRTLGGERSVFGVSLYKYKDKEASRVQIDTVFHKAIDLQTDKLGLALMRVHPLEGIETGDLDSVLGMGYRGVQQLGDLAMRRNSELGEYRYPVPMSYSHGRSDAEAGTKELWTVTSSIEVPRKRVREAVETFMPMPEEYGWMR